MDDSLLELVRDWLTRANHDLRSARALAALEEPLLDTAIYHCQQTAEKSVKAWLQSKDDPFPKTHDLEALVKQAESINPDFRRFAKAASVRRLTFRRFDIPVVQTNQCHRAKNSTKHCSTLKRFTISL